MPKPAPTPSLLGRVLPRDIVAELDACYLDYAMSVLAARALPDARDGLKPVQRRILAIMLEQGLQPGRPHKKSAAVVGDTLGRYHPHGDASVYEAMVRLAQPFVMNEPLVDGQGNWGSIDGDPAAAYRYTEARLTPAAAALLADLDRDTVDFRPNFDGRLQEPSVLPAALPNLLLNGSEGIAVGMATRIPPHNLRELVAAVEVLCDRPEADDAAVLAKLKGPDFPTGALLVQSPEIKELYRTGRGKLAVRARVAEEKVKSGRIALVVTEIPFGVSKTKLIEDVVALVRDAGKPAGKPAGKDGKGTSAPKATAARRAPAHPWADWIADLRDESDRDGLRMVIELRKDAPPAAVLDALYQKTDLQATYPAQLIALVDGTPTVLTLRRALEVFIAHRLTVVVRRARYERDQAARRAHVVAGLLVAIAAIRKVVDLIRGAKGRAEAKLALLAAFPLDEGQVDAILALRLASLTALDVTELKTEQAALAARVAELDALLGSEAAQRAAVRDETRALAQQFGRPRRTEIVAPGAAADMLERAAGDAADVTVSEAGVVRVLPAGAKGRRASGDPDVARVALAKTEHAVVFTRAGRAVALHAHDVPSAAQAAGVPLARAVAGLAPDDRPLWVAGPADFARGGSVLFVLANGLVKRTGLAEYQAPRPGGVEATTLQPEDRLVAVVPAPDEAADAFLATAGGLAIRFPVAQVPLHGRAARGVWGIKLADGDAVVAGSVVVGEILVLTATGHGKRLPAAAFRPQGRAGQGLQLGRFGGAAGAVVFAGSVPTGRALAARSAKGTVCRLATRDFPKAERESAPSKVAAIADWVVVGAVLLPAS